MEKRALDIEALERVRVLIADAEEKYRALQPYFARVAQLRRELHDDGSRPEVAAALESAELEAMAANAEYSRLVDEISRASGIPEEVLEGLGRQCIASDPVDRTPRASVRSSEVAPTAMLEEVVPIALERLLARVPQAWLAEQAQVGHRLDASFLSRPLQIFRGVRVESERRPVNRFAQMLLLAQDFLREDPGYDWFAGALLVPQLASLGVKLALLDEVRGGVADRVSGLWRLPSGMTDATVYELLVAASCVSMGRRVEFLSVGQAKSPDLRIHGYPFPLVVECKRKQLVTDADVAEAGRLEALYRAIRPACISRGMTGVISLHLDVEPAELPQSEVVAAAIRQRLAPDPRQKRAYPWGEIAFRPTRRRMPTPATRLYSPNYLRAVFGWDTDVPAHDGIICQVRTPPDMMVDEAREPLALVWTNRAPSIVRRRARTTAALLGSALRQVPPGEMGLVYICYNEGDREAIADDRSRFLQGQLRDWTHEWHIRAPALLMTRLIPRPLGDGGPDLIETGLQYYGETTGSPQWFLDFPSRVFT